MDTDSFIAYIKTDDIYKAVGENVQTKFKLETRLKLD